MFCSHRCLPEATQLTENTGAIELDARTSRVPTMAESDERGDEAFVHLGLTVDKTTATAPGPYISYHLPSALHRCTVPVV